MVAVQHQAMLRDRVDQAFLPVTTAPPLIGVNAPVDVSVRSGCKWSAAGRLQRGSMSSWISFFKWPAAAMLPQASPSAANTSRNGPRNRLSGDQSVIAKTTSENAPP